ncbi:MAG: hypothetical protein HZB87_09030 [Desulfatitalea sp.]|nr:hypothetical protein [Desulfatitalea sp.]
MTPSLPVTCWVGEPPAMLTAADAQWRLPLPADRHAGPSTLPTVSYGDYFTAVDDYLKGEGRAALALALRNRLGREFHISEVGGIQIHLVKHGAFYHPARVTVTIGAQRLALVLNVAVSPAGRERLTAEAAHLARLEADFSPRFIPRVYGWGTGRSGDREPLPMFLGEWLDGFHELHPTLASGNRKPWAVWDPEQGRWHLSEHQAAEFLRQAVFILTHYFDPHTLAAIQAWHHAAGDFVVRAQGAGLEVCLISVRRYAPLFHLEKDDSLTIERLLGVLSVFFLRTSLWMRLDRLDGVGDLTWAGDAVLVPMWQGFAQGLESMARRNDFPESFVPGVIAYLAGHDREAWKVLGETILARFPTELPETDLLRRHLARHAHGLAQIVKSRKV